jgi:hypothetical protein
MTAKKRIRIVSNGRAGIEGDTRVFIDGEDVSNSLARVEWSISANEMSRATLTFYPAEVEVEFTAAASEDATVVPSEYFDDLVADLDAPDEPNERVRKAARLLPGVVRREEA